LNNPYEPCHKKLISIINLVYLTTKWLLTINDALANNILNNTFTLIIPAVNGDNYNYDRENANGVYLNRNFATKWERAGITDPEIQFFLTFGWI
jgi:murein tripeptide amidase MpaA